MFQSDDQQTKMANRIPFRDVVNPNENGREIHQRC